MTRRAMVFLGVAVLTGLALPAAASATPAPEALHIVGPSTEGVVLPEQSGGGIVVAEHKTFPAPLRVLVVEGGRPAPEVVVEFYAMGGGVEFNVPEHPWYAAALTNAQGVATSPRVVALSLGTSTVAAFVPWAPGQAPIRWVLWDLTAVPAAQPVHVSVVGSRLVLAGPSHAFAGPLRARVTEGGRPLSGYVVTFRIYAPSNGPHFRQGLTAQAVTGPDGIATSPPLVAGQAVGGYTLWATGRGSRVAWWELVE